MGQVHPQSKDDSNKGTIYNQGNINKNVPKPYEFVSNPYSQDEKIRQQTNPTITNTNTNLNWQNFPQQPKIKNKGGK